MDKVSAFVDWSGKGLLYYEIDSDISKFTRKIIAISPVLDKYERYIKEWRQLVHITWDLRLIINCL